MKRISANSRKGFLCAFLQWIKVTYVIGGRAMKRENYYEKCSHIIHKKGSVKPTTPEEEKHSIVVSASIVSRKNNAPSDSSGPFNSSVHS